jgi:hypothetical protein
MTEVAMRSRKSRSWLMSRIVPVYSLSISSRTSSVSRSRSFVGSSRTRRLEGFASARASMMRPRSPPDRTRTGVRACSGENRKSFR